MPSLHGLALSCGMLALGAAVLGIYWLSGGGRLGRIFKRLLGALVLTLAAVLGIGAWDLYSYSREGGTPIAELSFQRVEPQRFQVELIAPGADVRVFELLGDEWQLDARLLRPNGRLSRLLRAPYFRLERLSGRYRNPVDELNRPRSVYALAEPGPGLDVAAWLERVPESVRPLRSGYGSAAFLPMADGARYVVYIDGRGLSANPANEPAARAVDRWFGG